MHMQKEHLEISQDLLAGWSLLIASWSSIAVFPLAFVAYLEFFIPHMSPSLADHN